LRIFRTKARPSSRTLPNRSDFPAFFRHQKFPGVSFRIEQPRRPLRQSGPREIPAGKKFAGGINRKRRQKIFSRKGLVMKKYLGVGMLCMSLMVSGRAMADNDNHGFVNKSCEVDYKIDSCDLTPPCDQPVNYDINKCKNPAPKAPAPCPPAPKAPAPCPPAPKAPAPCPPAPCPPAPKAPCPPAPDCNVPTAGCPTNDDGKDCGGDNHCCPKPPCDPTPKTPVVPLPASSALGGVGLAALALTSWIKRRRASIA
jgi:hypothetical protein